jgi:hypothetical protein
MLGVGYRTWRKSPVKDALMGYDNNRNRTNEGGMMYTSLRRAVLPGLCAPCSLVVE